MWGLCAQEERNGLELLAEEDKPVVARAYNSLREVRCWQEFLRLARAQQQDTPTPDQLCTINAQLYLQYETKVSTNRTHVVLQ